MEHTVDGDWHVTSPFISTSTRMKHSAQNTIRIRLHLYVPSMSPFFVPFKNEFNIVLWRCLHVMLRRSKVPLTKTVMLTVRVNKNAFQ